MPRTPKELVDSGDLPESTADMHPDAPEAKTRGPRRAKDTPVVTSNRHESGDQAQSSAVLQPGLDSDLELPDHEEIVPDVLSAAGRKSYLALLAFMEEKVVVEVSDTTDKNAEPMPAIYVNGVAQFFPRGVPVTCRRKYVEGLVRAKPIAIRTQVDERNSENPSNRLIRSAALQYPFQIVRDDNPRGRSWLTALLQEDQVARA